MAEDGIKAEAEAHPALTAVGSGNRSSFPCCTHPQCSAAAPSIKVGRGSAHGEGASVCWGMSERVNGWTGWMVAQWPGLAQACEWIGVGEAKVPFVQAREHQRRNRTCPMELHARLVDGLMVGTASLSGCHRHRAAMRLARRLGHHHQHRVRCARTGALFLVPFRKCCFSAVAVLVLAWALVLLVPVLVLALVRLLCRHARAGRIARSSPVSQRI